jgi:type I restriction enzyme R subunit
MIVSMSRRIAAELYSEIIKLRPDWNSDDLTKGKIKVVMTAASSDGPLLAKHHTNKEQRKLLAERMKDDEDPLELVIVRDMWLTGFDAPSMHTLYIDKPMKGHKKRYIDAVTALSKAFSIAIPHEQAMGAKDEVAFFQAVKARLVKFESSGEETSEVDIETSIRQVIDKALVSDQVIDVFDAAGIKKPDISILSDEFLAELKDHEHQNIALEVLRKLLNDELKSRARKNLVQSKALLEMLETSIKRYQNKILTAAEVMDELIKLSKEIVASDDEAKKLGLSDFEYAFYTAVASNDSARELMQQEKLRELAVVLTKKVRENASIDWTIKESVKSKLKVIVKRLLRQYGYPPDMQLLATETVLRQAEMIADELAGAR